MAIMENKIFKSGELTTLLEKRAEIAINAGADGVIASPQEIKLLRKNIFNTFLHRLTYFL